MRWLRHVYLFFDDKVRHLRESILVVLPGIPGVVVAVQNDRYNIEDNKRNIYVVEPALLVRGLVESTQESVFNLTPVLNRRYIIEAEEIPI